MTREFCDRCDVEVTGEQSSAIHGIENADKDGNGTHTHGYDIVCPRCYQAWIEFMDTKPPRPTRARRSKS